MENGNLIIEHSTYINSAVERVGDSITNVSFTLEPFKSGNTYCHRDRILKF